MKTKMAKFKSTALFRSGETFTTTDAAAACHQHKLPSSPAAVSGLLRQLMKADDLVRRTEPARRGGGVISLWTPSGAAKRLVQQSWRVNPAVYARVDKIRGPLEWAR